MSVQLNCTICWEPLQEGDVTHIPHTDGTPTNRKHIGDGIHPDCLREWVRERSIHYQPITCPLGCPDKLIAERKDPLSLCDKGRVLLLTGGATVLMEIIGQLVTREMALLFRHFGGSRAAVYSMGTGFSCGAAVIVGYAVHFTLFRGVRKVINPEFQALNIITAMAWAGISTMANSYWLGGDCW